MSAKDMFDNLGYKYELINNKDINCEDVILYTQTKQDLSIQFNLFSESVCFKIKNKFKDYDKVAIFMTKELLNAINKQVEELRWNK